MEPEQSSIQMKCAGRLAMLPPGTSRMMVTLVLSPEAARSHAWFCLCGASGGDVCAVLWWR
ncbi:hypothetical protein GCM10011583_34710 [Streptomyces camponoticapitis]|uniref:Uncharacterized protein n=1 Tax=Streptomyces camponoticapitis TaxID=1616125 RepID=A0ABQ2E845_9ACTN|nr:hypothetical protein GCM10011583_34710 [Streptomyces camponoticapitis]